ncbi:MAG TPA: PQQ-binding-like beta-propeller repeat protein [Gemmataceae bacterium]|nr:PQQ-binding-like beta-propeller repeat protein [Gemmataceae bacterium]
MTLFCKTAGCLILIVEIIGQSRASDWPQFLGPARNGVSKETNLVKAWGKEGPKLIWEKPVGEGYSGPIIAGGIVILFHRIGDQEVIEALNADSSKQLWSFSYDTVYQDDLGKGDGPRSTPLTADGFVYTLGAEGKLHCLDLKSGKKEWERDLAKDYPFRKGFFGVATSPIQEGDNIIINIGCRTAGIVALNKKTGKEAWKATNQEASYSSPTAATINGQRQLVFLTREGLVALDPATGKILHEKRWRSRMAASVNAAAPVVVDNQVFLSACYGTGAVLLNITKDGLEEVWKNDETLSNHYNTSIHHDGYLYGVDGRQEEGPQLRCVELKTGKVKWTEKGFGCASLILADGRFYALTENGDLVIFEASSTAYRELARSSVLTAPCRSPLALAEGRLYARDNKKLACWEIKKE